MPFDQRLPADHLRTVAEMFIETQQRRESADYDLATAWQLEDLKLQVLAVEAAFASWRVIRDDLEAQKLLVWMLESKQRQGRP